VLSKGKNLVLKFTKRKTRDKLEKTTKKEKLKRRRRGIITKRGFGRERTRKAKEWWGPNRVYTSKNGMIREVSKGVLKREERRLRLKSRLLRILYGFGTKKEKRLRSQHQKQGEEKEEYLFIFAEEPKKRWKSAKKV